MLREKLFFLRKKLHSLRKIDVFKHLDENHIPYKLKYDRRCDSSYIKVFVKDICVYGYYQYYKGRRF